MWSLYAIANKLKGSFPSPKEPRLNKSDGGSLASKGAGPAGGTCTGGAFATSGAAGGACAGGAFAATGAAGGACAGGAFAATGAACAGGAFAATRAAGGVCAGGAFAATGAAGGACAGGAFAATGAAGGAAGGACAGGAFAATGAAAGACAGCHGAGGAFAAIGAGGAFAATGAAGGAFAATFGVVLAFALAFVSFESFDSFFLAAGFGLAWQVQSFPFLSEPKANLSLNGSTFRVLKSIDPMAPTSFKHFYYAWPNITLAHPTQNHSQAY